MGFKQHCAIPLFEEPRKTSFALTFITLFGPDYYLLSLTTVTRVNGIVRFPLSRSTVYIANLQS